MARPLTRPTTLLFIERYDEMHGIGLSDWEIARKMGLSLTSLERMLKREQRQVDTALRDMARDERNGDA